MTTINNDNVDILYKYSGLLGLGYFESPTIKLSILEKLNDPFEYTHSEDIRTVIKSTFKNIGLEDELHDIYISDFISFFKETIERNGIISFTETPRNNLMWSHYANNHKGMCIGYKSNLLRDVCIDTTKNHFHIDLNTPQKIKYDNNRITPEDHAIKQISSGRKSVSEPSSIYRELAKKQLLKKGDEWLYEKEHRIILPYAASDKIKFNLNSGYKNEVGTASIMEWMEKYSMIQPTSINDTYEILKVTDGYISYIKERDDISFLIDIDVNDIDSVYIGCKAPKKYTRALVEKIRDEDLNIDVYLSKISKTRFEIEHHLITADNLESIYEM